MERSEQLSIAEALILASPEPIPLPRLASLIPSCKPAAARALVDELNLDTYYPFHATRADLLRRLGRHHEATAAYQRAAALAPTDAERAFLRHGGRTQRRADQ